MTSRIHKGIGLALVTMLALVLRIHHLDYESLFMDELRQVSYYSNSFIEIVGNAATTQQPPLDYWIGHIFFYFSQSDFSARLPAALFGTGSVWLIIKLAARDTPWVIAVSIGLLMALSPYHIYFSQDARPYAISIFFLLAFLCALEAI
ncbi:MAG: glycosyltransferase family 39 protein, partial [Pseudomonadota bacterium]